LRRRVDHVAGNDGVRAGLADLHRIMVDGVAGRRDQRNEVVERVRALDDVDAVGGHDREYGSTIERAKASAAKMRLELAKREMKEFYNQSNVRTLDLAKARRRLDGMVAGEAADTMMAARKGGKLSERDEDGIVDDLAQLEALENEASEEGEE
jgi:hypothetical protein